VTDPTTTNSISARLAPTDTTPATPITTTSVTGQGNPSELSNLSGGWQVTPDQVSAFASAVQQVRGDLNAVLRQVDLLTSPSYQPQLGSSPVGRALTAKFVDRLSGDQGLLASLNAVLAHLDDFVSNAEQTASLYQGTETSTTDMLRSL